MATLDKLKSDIDRGMVAVLGSAGQDSASYVEKNNHKYGGEVAGEEIEERDFEELLKRLRTRERPTYDASWSAHWEVMSPKKAMTCIKRPLDWYQKVTGLKDYHLSRKAQVESALLRHAREGGHIAPGPAQRICNALGEELGLQVQPTMIKWHVLS